MRWMRKVGTLALLFAASTGCKQQCFLTECDHEHYRSKLAGDLVYKPDPPPPTPSVMHSQAPRTINDPDRPIRYISLAEAISLALEQGSIGPTSLRSAGGAISGGFAGSIGIPDTVATFTGRGVGGADNIRVFALDPAIQGTQIEAALSKFDAVWATSMTWNTTDRPIGTALDAFQAGRSGAINAIQTDAATFSTSLIKPLPTGGVAGITFNMPYQFTNLAARVNPSYSPSLQFSFEQPLLQGFGVEINQLRAAHPGSILLPGALNTQPTAEGILITRLRFDQQRAEFERLVQFQVLNVEFAYWDLYSAYWRLYSREAALRQAYEAWKLVGSKFQAGRLAIADFAQTRGQYELFRGQRISALGEVLERERNLRKLLGLPAEDGYRLVPSDKPTLAPYKPDWDSAICEALALRPDVVLAREELKVQILEVKAAENQLLPDLRLTSTYDVNAIGTRFDGAGPNNAFRGLTDNNFHNWSIGLRLNVPLGFRAAHAALRQQRLEVARAAAFLKEVELTTERFLVRAYRDVFENYEQIKAQRAQREAFGIQLQVQGEKVAAGSATVDVLLEAQRFWADALANEYEAIRNYNQSLANWEFAKGTILRHNNIHIAEGALPRCAMERAVENQKKRSLALVAATRPLEHKPCCAAQCAPVLPQLPEEEAASLPELMKGAPPVPVNEKLTLPTEKPGLTPITLPTTGPVPDTKSSWAVPEARPQQFGAARMLPPTVSTRDSAPSLMPLDR